MTCTVMATDCNRDLASIALSVLGAMIYVTAGLAMAVLGACCAACPSLPAWRRRPIGNCAERGS